MIKVNLTTEQAAELRNYYIEELERIQKRSAEILNLLKAIGQEHSTVEPSAPAKPKEKPSQESSEQKSVESKTKPPGWSEYIIKLLSERERAVTRDQIFKSYQKEYDVNFPDPNAAKNTLSQALHYLQNTKKLIEGTPRKGKRGNIYRLIEVKEAGAEEKKKPLKSRKEKKGRPEPVKKVAPPDDQYANLIIETLGIEKRVLNRDEFVQFALEKIQEAKGHKIATRGKIAKSLSFLWKETGQIKKTKKADASGTFYGLSEWFDNDNNLKPEYK